MKIKALIPLLLCCYLPFLGLTQVGPTALDGYSLDSLNHFLEGKWNWYDCEGGWGPCSIPGPGYSTTFSKISGDSLQIEVRNGSILVGSRATTAVFTNTAFGSKWTFDPQPIDPVFGTPQLFPFSYALYVDTAFNLIFGQMVLDGQSYYYERDTTSAPTGFSAVELDQVTLFPNPTAGKVCIDFGNFGLANDNFVRVVNGLGQTVFESKVTDSRTFVDMSALGGRGIYFISVREPKGQVVWHRKVILQ